jgi:DNA invertase Pin-like site-specific DNA recombinase
VAADRVFRDDGYSGASLKRPGLDRLRDVAASARLDRILVTEPDWLARNFVHQTLLVEELQKHGAEVAFLDRPMSRDPHDQLLLQIRGAVAEYERTLITERMRRGRLRKLRAGTLLSWTRPPYGYRLDSDRPRDPAGVRLDEAEAAVVRNLFVWFADEGQSIYALKRRLDQLGIASPRGHRPWSTSALHGVLTNPTYVGQVFANRVRARLAGQRRSALLPVGRSGMGATQALDAAEWIAVAPMPAIVSQAQFDRAQERLAYNRQMAQRNNRMHPYLLRGLVSCGQCRLACCGRCTRAGLCLLRVPDQATVTAAGARRALPGALHPSLCPGRPGLARSVRGACRARDDRARDGSGARRPLAAAGVASAPGQPAPRPGGSRPAGRAAHGRLPCRRRAYGRIPAPPPGHRGTAAGAGPAGDRTRAMPESG